MRHTIHLLIALGFTFILVAFQCGDDCDDLYLEYPLVANISDDDNALSLADTLWLEADFGTSIISAQGFTWSLSNTACELDVAILALDASAGAAFEWFAADSTQWVGDAPSSDVSKQQGTVFFDCTEERCRFRVGIRPLRTGTYCLQLLEGIFDKGYMGCGVKKFLDNRIGNPGATTSLVAALDTTLLTLPSGESLTATVDVTGAGASFYVFEVRE